MVSVNVREQERYGNRHNKKYQIHEKEESRFYHNLKRENYSFDDWGSLQSLGI